LCGFSPHGGTIAFSGASLLWANGTKGSEKRNGGRWYKVRESFFRVACVRNMMPFVQLFSHLLLKRPFFFFLFNIFHVLSYFARFSCDV
jgi:hypothetical protein